MGGTYYPSSGTYVSPSGQGSSTATIPAGATISFGTDPNLGGGSSSGGGGHPDLPMSTIETPTPAATVPTPTPTPQDIGDVTDPLRPEASRVAIGQSYLRGQKTAQAQRGQGLIRKEGEMFLSRKGGVEFKGRTYYGKAIVPLSGGKTASQIQAQARQEAKARGLSGRRGTFEASVSPAQQQEQQFQRGQQSAGELLFGGGGVPMQDVHATRTDLGQRFDIPIYKPGTIYSSQTGITEGGIPIIDTRFIKEDWSSRLATREEQLMLDPLTVKEGGRTTKVGQIYGEELGKIKKFAKTDWAPGTYIGEKLVDYTSDKGKTLQRIGGGVAGLIPKTKGGFLVTAATLGIGAGVGAGIRGGTYALSRIPRYGQTIASGFKATTFGAGLVIGGIYTQHKITAIRYAPTPFAEGEIVGQSIREIGAFGYGTKVGAKGFDMYAGWRATRGRTFLETKQGIYPTAPTRTHLKLFQRNIIRELGKEPGAFHVTGEKFWKDVITPTKGSSELPGLYGSTQVSTPFARITGSAGSRLKLILDWKDILSVPGKPAIAYLIPKGFRYFPATSGKWYKPAKEGYADVPGIKAEIEAIFRERAGGYTFEAGKYYTVIKGVRVPIDVFKYDPSLPAGTGDVINLQGGAKGGYSGYKPASYLSSPKAYNLISSSDIKSVSKVSPVSSSVSNYISKSSFIPISSKTSITSYKSSIRSSIRSSRVSPSSSISSYISKSSLTPSYSKVSKTSYVPYGYGGSGRSYYPPYRGYSYPPYKPPKSPPPHKLKPAKQVRKGFGSYEVLGRRFGKWKVIGKAKDPLGATGIGKKWARQTLGVSFKVPKFKGEKIPGFRTKKEKGETIFIEPKRKRIKRGTKEIPELQYWKGIKSPIKKLKGGKRK